MKKTLIAVSVCGLLLTACVKPTHQASDDIQNTPQTQAAQNQQAPHLTVDSDHNAQNSLDWHGSYKGLLPCADCEGIETELKLNPDNTFELEEEYNGGKGEGKKFESKGKFTFDATGSIVTLGANERKFFVGENFIESREIETGKKIEGPLAEHYKLTKELH